MNFEISESTRIHGNTDRLRSIGGAILKLVTFFLLLLIFIPVGVYNLISRLLGMKRELEFVPPKWKKLLSVGDFIVEYFEIDEEELPEGLDYPEEPGDIYLFKCRTEPRIHELDGMFFCHNYCELHDKLFLVSYNEAGMGHTLWLIDPNNRSLKHVKDLVPSYWWLKAEDDKLVLHTTYKKKDLQIEVKII